MFNLMLQQPGGGKGLPCHSRFWMPCHPCRLLHLPDSPLYPWMCCCLWVHTEGRGQLGRVLRGKAGGQGHQGSHISAPAQPDGHDPSRKAQREVAPAPQTSPLAHASFVYGGGGQQ